MNDTNINGGVDPKRRLKVRATVKALLSASCLTLLMYQIGTESLKSTLLQANPLTVASLLLLLCGLGILQATRWWLIGNGLGLKWSLLTATELAFVGAFFNQLLPSSSGGDAVRAWKLAKAGVSVRKAVSSVFLDRISALFAIGLICICGVSVLYGLLTRQLGSIDTSTLYILLGLSIALFAVIAWSIASFTVIRQSRIIQIVFKLAEDARTIVKSPSLMAITTVMSLLIQVGVAYIVWQLATDFGARLDFVEFSLLWPVVLILSFLPISIAGWGVREGAMMFAFHLLGNSSAIALATSIAFGILMIFASLPGGILWFLSSFNRHARHIGLNERPE